MKKFVLAGILYCSINVLGYVDLQPEFDFYDLISEKATTVSQVEKSLSKVDKGSLRRLKKNAALSVISGGNLEVFNYLVEGEIIDINALDPYTKANLLFAAIFFRNDDIAKALIKAGIDVNYETPEKETALLEAIRIGTIEIITFLLDSGADINHKNKSGTTALRYAIYSRFDIKIVSLLLDRGAKSPFEPIEAKEFLKAHTNPSQYSIEGARSEVVQLLKDRNII